MKTIFLTIVLTVCATAQTPPEPPALVRVIRSPLQPYTQLYADAHAKVTVLGMTSISGPSETWLNGMSASPLSS